ncbi:MAG: hypothetical protein WD229_01635, partial [Pirellulales bacterium]
MARPESAKGVELLSNTLFQGVPLSGFLDTGVLVLCNNDRAESAPQLGLWRGSEEESLLMAKPTPPRAGATGYASASTNARQRHW